MLSPLVRRLVAENGLDVGAITGTGVGGRIRREDVEKALASGGATAPRPAAAPAPVAAPAAAPQHRHRAAPPPDRSRSRPGPTTRATRSSRCPGCGWRWPAG